MQTAVLVLLWSTVAAAAPGADEHLLAGARHFRAERYADALVEFRIAEKLGSADAREYAAAALVKLDRPEQAVEAFEARGPAPARDALLDYYHALACYEARLYGRADALLARVGERSGPRIARQAAAMREEIAGLLRAEPSRESIDWYLARCDATAKGNRPVLARAYCEEARLLASRRPDRHGAAAAAARLGASGSGVEAAREVR